MRRLGTGLRWLLLCGAAATCAPVVGAATPAPSAQALLAEQDAEFVAFVARWTEEALQLPADMPLDPPLRAALASSAKALSGRLKTLVPTWIAEERTAAKDPAWRGAELAHALLQRSLNELVIGFVESTGAAHDEAWLQAALAPTACQTHYPMFYARRIAFVQAAPPEAQPALLAAEQALLARWGTVSASLPARPADADMQAAAQAAAQLRDGLPVAAEPMTPFLARMVFARERQPAKLDRRERCATSQWWLKSQLATPGADRAMALQVFRFSLLPDVSEMVPERVKADTAADTPYPPVARHFQVEGTITVRARLDEQGQVQRAEVVARKLRVPGIRGQRPLAFETLLDDASLAWMRRRSFDAQPAREVHQEIVWKLEGDRRGPR